MTDTAIAVAAPPQALTEYRPQLIRPIAAIDELIQSHKQVAEVIQRALVSGQDYGVIPGTGRGDKAKPTLLKPGAERLLMAFGCYADFIVLEREADHDREIEWHKTKRVYNNATREDKTFREVEATGVAYGLYRYVVKANIVMRSTGEIIGTGIGVCSSVESKYCDRPRDLENTIQKMAGKRALVAAALGAFGLSDRFTQDLDDMAPESDGPVSHNGNSNGNGVRPAPGPAPAAAGAAPSQETARKFASWREILQKLYVEKGFPEEYATAEVGNLANMGDGLEQRDRIASITKDLKGGVLTPFAEGKVIEGEVVEASVVPAEVKPAPEAPAAQPVAEEPMSPAQRRMIESLLVDTGQEMDLTGMTKAQAISVIAKLRAIPKLPKADDEFANPWDA